MAGADSISSRWKRSSRIRLPAPGDAKGWGLRAVGVGETVLAGKRADFEELARLLEHAPVGRERNDRAAKIGGGFLRPAGAVEGSRRAGTAEGLDDTLGA